MNPKSGKPGMSDTKETSATVPSIFSFARVEPATGRGGIEGMSLATFKFGPPAATACEATGLAVPGKGNALDGGYLSLSSTKPASPFGVAPTPLTTNLGINPPPVVSGISTPSGSVFGIIGFANSDTAKTTPPSRITQPETVTSVSAGVTGSPDASTACSSAATQERIEEFLRKSLLGEQLVDIQFHLFTTRSSPLSQVIKPRVLCVNNVLLAKSSKYFSEMLESDTSSPDHSLVNLPEGDDVPNGAGIDEYGYESDSDLEDLGEPIHKAAKNRSATLSSSPSITSTETHLENDGLEQLGGAKPRPVSEGEDESVVRSKSAIHETPDDRTLADETIRRLRFLGSRRVLVKDTAFRTWYTLLNYLYTEKIRFLPLNSAGPGGRPCEPSSSSIDLPRCSAKSMYRLACKVGLDQLRDEAFAYVRSNLTEHNIVKELSSSLLGKHPQLLDLELDVLYSHIASPPVVADFPALARRIANKELAHGADMIIGIHTRLLRIPGPVAKELKDDEVKAL